MRLFIAVELPPAAQQSIDRIQQELGTHLRAAGLERILRWTMPANVHLTLRFLGETSATQQAALERSLDQITRRHAPLYPEIRGAGAFPSFRRPSVFWVGIAGRAQDLSALGALQAAIEQLVCDAGLPPDDRPFTPHLTLARFQREASAPDLARCGTLLQRLVAEPPLAGWREPFPVESVVLMRSDLQPRGAIYTPVNRYALTG